MKLSRLICEICSLARAVSSFVEAEIEKRCPGEIVVPLTAYKNLPQAPQKQELRDLLRRQSPAALYMLLTLWRLGRGDFAPDDDLLNEYLEAGDSFPNVRAVEDYLMGRQLPHFFDKALYLLKEAGIEVDELLE